MERPFILIALVLYLLAILTHLAPGMGYYPIILLIIAGILVCVGILTGK